MITKSLNPIVNIWWLMLSVKNYETNFPSEKKKKKKKKKQQLRHLQDHLKTKY